MQLEDRLEVWVGTCDPLEDVRLGMWGRMDLDFELRMRNLIRLSFLKATVTASGQQQVFQVATIPSFLK